MKSIYYASNMQSHLFPDNTRSKFNCFINPQDLNYISKNDYIEVAVKSITIDNDIDENCFYGLKSSLSGETISSFGYDTIISLFSSVKTKKGINIYRFSNPVFFQTSHHKLCNVTFEIIDLRTREQPFFKYGSPTFIEVIVRRSTLRMKPPFNILIDSSCAESKIRFPSNTNTDFTIQLPKRLEFSRDWILCLKSIHFENKFKAFQTFKISMFGKRKVDGISFGINVIVEKKTEPETVNGLIRRLQSIFNGYLKVSLFRGRIRLTPDKAFESNSDYTEQLGIKLSKDLVNVLGLDHKYTNFIMGKGSIIGHRKVDMTANYPNHFIVCCDICDETVLSGSPIQILKYFPREKHDESKFDIEFTNNDFVKLNMKSFDRIRFRIADLSGRTINSLSHLPTRLQILFVNTNSL